MMSQTIDSPLDAVTCRNPYPYYARLTSERPLYFDQSLDLWVASSAAIVDEVLDSTALGVRPPGEEVPGSLAGSATGDVFQRLIRMNDGPYHKAARPAVESALKTLSPGVVRSAAREVGDLLLEQFDVVDPPESIHRFMFQFPVSVIARLTGIKDSELELTARSTGIFVDALKPGSSQIARDLGDAASSYLLDRFGAGSAGGSSDLLENLTGTLEWDIALANALGLLMQSYEATAGLIGNALVELGHLAGDGVTMADVDERFVHEVARFDSPVQNTRRFAAVDCTIYGEQVSRGQAVLVILAAANRDPAVNPNPARFQLQREAARLYTFGRGAHHCPGAILALEIAVEAIAVLTRAGISVDSLPHPEGYVPSTNVRIPRFVAGTP